MLQVGFDKRILTCTPAVWTLTAVTHCYSATLAYACQDEAVAISCKNDSIIHIINANYGRLGNELCLDNIGESNFECVFSGTRDIAIQA